ncbi:MAG: hypothetical protein H0X51_02730 [Parachlamydiaceae bacterium]|nr:hypothetical protein [Parachlamydiaceae bacterium]
MTIDNCYFLAEHNFYVKVRDTSVANPNRARVICLVGEIALIVSSPIILPLATIELLLRTITRGCAHLISRSERTANNLKHVSWMCAASIKSTLWMPLSVVIRIVSLIPGALLPLQSGAMHAIPFDVAHFARNHPLTPFQYEMLSYQANRFKMDVVLGNNENNWKFFTRPPEDCECKHLRFREQFYNLISSSMTPQEKVKLKSFLSNRSVTTQSIYDEYHRFLFPIEVERAKKASASFLTAHKSKLSKLQLEIFKYQLARFCKEYDPKNLHFFKSNAEELENLQWRQILCRKAYARVPQRLQSQFEKDLFDRNKTKDFIKDYMNSLLPAVPAKRPVVSNTPMERKA